MERTSILFLRILHTLLRNISGQAFSAFKNLGYDDTRFYQIKFESNLNQI